VEPAERPMIGNPPDPAAYHDYQKRLTQLEERNRDIYYNFIDGKSSEFRSKAAAYLMAAANYRKNNQDAIKRRNELISQYKLDRDLYQNQRFVRRDSGVFGPLLQFAEIPQEKFEERAGVV